jgi:hypothetical protein
MKNFPGITGFSPPLAALLLSALLTACGGGGGGQDPILGGLNLNATPIVPVAPTVSSVTPVSNATVAINTKVVTASFSEAMNPTTLDVSSFTLACPTGTAIAGAVGYTASTNTATLTLPVSPNLPVSTTCTATVTTGAIATNGLALATAYHWNFVTSAAADNTAPTVTSTINANGATGVATTTQVGATFSEAMDASTITASSFSVKKTLAGTTVAGTLAYAGLSVVFTPGAALAASTQYTVTVSTAVKDVAGNPMAANYFWSWTTAATPDTTAPTVTSTINANGATSVPTNTKVGATFSEAMKVSTLTSSNFILKQTSNGTVVTGTLAYSGLSSLFTPAVALIGNTQYTVTIKGGSSGASDLAGNVLLADYVWSWTTAATGDVTPPTVGVTNPVNLATAVCMNKTVNATFSEAMDPTTINNASFTLSVSGGGAAVAGLVGYDVPTHIASFNPTANLTGTTSYTATIKGGTSGVKDLAGNALVADQSIQFTTGVSTCATAPALGAMAPFGGFGGNATLTNDGLNTVVNGDIGVNAASTKITGLHDAGGNVYTVTTSNDGSVAGRIYTLTAPPGSVAGAAVTQARADALVAFNSISPANLPGGVDVSSLAQCPSCSGALQGPGQLAGRTLPPGIYLSTTGTYGIGITAPTAGNLILDAAGDANAVWVFQTAAGTGALTVGLTGPATPAVPIQVLLINGAQAKNVFWYVPAGATIGTGSTMVGTILSDAAITFSTTGGTPPTAVLTTLNGRAIALTAGVTMTNTVINVPAP